jgi:hypothetical protein
MPTETLKRDGKADIEAATTSSFVILAGEEQEIFPLVRRLKASKQALGCRIGRL